MGAQGTVSSLWKGASPLKRLLLVAVPVAVIGIAAAGITFAAVSGGGGDDTDAQATAPSATPDPTATTPPTPTTAQILLYIAALASPTPEPQASTGGGGGGGGGGGTGGAAAAPARPTGTGPGAVTGTGMSINIPKAGVNAGVYSRTVGTNGVMGNPSGAWDVIWYDFSTFGAGMGGYPGQPGANAVFAGHVDYIRVGPAVFYSVKNLAAGDQVTVNTPNGPVTYAIQWSQWAGPADDFTSFVAQNGQETITLVTCIGGFSAGHYSNRLIVRGVRI